MVLKIVRKSGSGGIVSTAGIVVGGGAVLLDITTAGGTTTLPTLSGGSYIYIHNSTASLAVVPSSVTEGAVCVLIDANGTAGSFPISFHGTIAGVTNPVLIDTPYTSATIQFHSGNWYRIL